MSVSDFVKKWWEGEPFVANSPILEKAAELAGSVKAVISACLSFIGLAVVDVYNWIPDDISKATGILSFVIMGFTAYWYPRINSLKAEQMRMDIAQKKRDLEESKQED